MFFWVLFLQDFLWPVAHWRTKFLLRILPVGIVIACLLDNGSITSVLRPPSRDQMLFPSLPCPSSSSFLAHFFKFKFQTPWNWQSSQHDIQLRPGPPAHAPITGLLGPHPTSLAHVPLDLNPFGLLLTMPLTRSPQTPVQPQDLLFGLLKVGTYF